MTDRYRAYLDRGVMLPSADLPLASNILQSGSDRAAFARIIRAARACRPMLIRGEAGTGKQQCARWFHQQGSRADKPLVIVRCTTLTSGLAAFQLWGHEAGVHPSARGRSLGVLRAASGGVVLFEEIGRLPHTVQAKLATALTRQEVVPVGSKVPLPIDIVPLATSSEDLQAKVADGRFDPSLYDVLSQVELWVPPLRECRDTIPRFVETLSRRYSARYARPVVQPDRETLIRLQRYHWPGNLRELSEVIERSYALDCAIAVPQ